MLRVYTVILYILAPLVLLRLAWRGLLLKSPDYMTRWRQRFGQFDDAPENVDIWLHAVSVGEVNAALPLIEGLLTRHPGIQIAVTTVTPTGSDRVRQVLDDKVFHIYAPYDLPGAVKRFLDSLNPTLAIVMETEIWPNVFNRCRLRGIPLLMINARVSLRSASRYRLIKPLVRQALACVSEIAAQSKGDAERLISLGANPELTSIGGNLKFDLDIPSRVVTKGRELRKSWGQDRPVWIAASTHEGEEEAALNVHRELLERLPDALLLIAPRHPERFVRVAALVRSRGFRTRSRGQHRTAKADTQCFVVDTIGELLNFYAGADAAFVGGSLARIGGHNILEPAALGVPVIVGPYTMNFAEIMELLCTDGAAVVVKNGQELGNAVLQLLSDRDGRLQMGEAGRAAVLDHRGAVDHAFQVIERYLQRPTNKGPEQDAVPAPSKV